MTIQAKIDAHLKETDLQPRTVIVLHGESGSFTLPASVRIILNNCNGAVCTSNEGNNELTFIGGTGCGADDFRNGVLRLEKTKGLKTIKAKNSRVTISSGQPKEVDLTDCNATFTNCEVQKASVMGGYLQSHDNTYQELKMGKGEKVGRILSRNDEIKKITTEAGFRGTFVKTKISGESTFDTGSLDIQDCEWDSEVTLQKFNLTARKFQFKTLVMTESTATLLDGKCEKEVTADGSVINANSCEFQKDLGLTNGTSLNMTESTLQGGITADTVSIVANNCSIQKDLDLTNTDARLSHFTVQGDATYEKASIQSSDCTFQGTVTGSNMTIDSESDTFQGNVNFSSLVGPNLIRNATAQNTIINGDGKSSIHMENVTSQQMTIADFAIANLIDVTSQQFELQEVSRALLDESSLGQSTVQDCGLVQIMPSTAMTQLQATNVDFLMTKNQTQMTADSCGIMDEGSQIAATNCRGWTRGSTVSGESNLLLNIGGTLAVTSSVVVSKGGTVGNLDGGLSMGKDFDPLTSSGSIVQAGDDMTIQTPFGIINIIEGIP